MDFRVSLRSEIERAKREAMAAQERYTFLRETLERYDRTANRTTSAKAERPARSQDRPRRATRSRSLTTRSRSLKRQAGSATKVSKIHTIVIQHKDRGITAPEVASLLRGQNMATTVNAVHSAFSKMKKARLIVRKGNKYFPSASLLKSAAGA